MPLLLFLPQDEKTEVAAAGAIPLLLACITRSCTGEGTPTLAQHAGLALMSLATKHAANKVAAAAAGGVATIITALKVHVRHEGATRALAYAIIKLARRNTANKAAFKSAGALEALAAVEAAHAGADAAAAARDAVARLNSWGMF